MLQKYMEKKYKKSRICEFVSKRAALLVLSGFILLKMFKSIHCCKKLGSIVSHEVLFIWLTTVAVTLTLSLKRKSVWRRLSVKTCIMLKPVNWLSLNVKWVASTWHKASLKGAFEKTLKSLKLLKFVKNTLKFLKCC